MLKSHGRKRLPQASLFPATPMSPLHFAAMFPAGATALVASTHVRSDGSDSKYGPPHNRLTPRCSLVLALLLASFASLLNDCLPIPTDVLAGKQTSPSAQAKVSNPVLAGEHASEATFRSGAFSTKSASQSTSADRHTVATASAASAEEGGPFRAAEAGGQYRAGTALPILVREPYLTDHPELTRTPLRVEADLTDESFEAVEQASLEIARAVHLQQQKQQRRAREEEYLGGVVRPSGDMQPSSSFTPIANGRLGREGSEGLAKTATRGSAAHSGPASQYKVVESAPSFSSAPGGDWSSTWSDDEVDEYGEGEAPAARHPKASKVGGRLIVGLTEITFPDIKRAKNSTSMLEKNPARQSKESASIMRKHTESSSNKHHKGAGGADGWWTDDDEHDGTSAGEMSNDEGEPLSHEEAVREANQRLRLDHLQALGLIRRVKVLENVGLVVLEFGSHLSVEEIKETVKTLWQRNRSTWLIEPDSDVVFRGRDSFAHGDFVPVVPTEEEQAQGADNSENIESDSAQQIHTFLPGQDEPPEPHGGQSSVPKKRGSQEKNIRRTNSSSKRSQIPNVPKQGKDYAKIPPMSRSRRVERSAQTVDTTEITQHGRPPASEQTLEHSANSSVFDVSIKHPKHAAESTEEHLQKVEKERKFDSNAARKNGDRGAVKRDLTMDSPAHPPIQRLQHRFHTYATNSVKFQEPARQGGPSGEAEQQTEREGTTFGTPRVTPVSKHVENHKQGMDTKPLFFASDVGEGNAEHASSFAPVYTPPTSLVKPHTGIVPLSVYDAAQEAVKEAIEEQISFRSVQVLSNYAGREECLEAFAACKQRHELEAEDRDRHTTYPGSTYSSGNTGAADKPSSPTAKDENSNVDANTKSGFPDRLFQLPDEQTVNEEQCKNEMETEAVGAEVDAPITGTTVSQSPAVTTSECSSGASVQAEIGKAAPAPLEEEPLTMAPNTGSTQEPPEDSAQRRIIFVSSVEPVSEKHLPNDQYFSRQWAYHGPRVNVQAVEAWNLLYKHSLTSHRTRDGVNGGWRPGNQKNLSSATAPRKVGPIVVAVIDTGNGYVDDYHGYDFENDESDPMDYNGHGTHVAGIIGAAANNKRGITGVTWEVKLMPLKFTARSAAAAEAIDYSLRMGAQISTNSWGYATPSAGLKLALRKTATKGQLFVSAVDNAGRDNTYTPDYPPNWGYDKRTKQGARNILRVANLTAAGGIAGTSNFGPNNVDVVAPGTDIISTVPTKRFPEGYGYKTGTSMATPLVAGIAAMVWSAQPALTAGDVRDCIVRTSKRLRNLENLVIAGNVNAYAAVLDVLGHPKESASDTQKEKKDNAEPPEAVPATNVFPPTAVPAISDRYSVYTPSTSPVLLSGNIFPSEEAFFQHIAQVQPAIVVDPPSTLSKLSSDPEVKAKSDSASAKAPASRLNAPVFNFASLLGPLHKLLFLE